MKSNQKIILESLSMDLLRAALGRHHGSHAMANRFVAEAKKRISELGNLNKMPLVLKIKDTLSFESERQAEDLLMYSTLIRNLSQNYV